jgi:hypothetical protein
VEDLDFGVSRCDECDFLRVDFRFTRMISSRDLWLPFLYLWLSNWTHKLNTIDLVRDAFAKPCMTL